MKISFSDRISILQNNTLKERKKQITQSFDESELNKQNKLPKRNRKYVYNNNYIVNIVNTSIDLKEQIQNKIVKTKRIQQINTINQTFLKDQNYFEKRGEKKSEIERRSSSNLKKYTFAQLFKNKKIQRQGEKNKKNEKEIGYVFNRINQSLKTKGKQDQFEDRDLIIQKRFVGLKKKLNDSQGFNKKPQKCFDISQLNFSFDMNKNANAQKVNNSKYEYKSLVDRTRYNIKRIIELNKLRKEKQQKWITQNKNYNQGLEQNLQILYKIKSGCFGNIYKGRFKDSGKLIAIKSILQDKRYECRQREICGMINNPFIVKILMIYESIQGVMERSQGKQKCQQNEGRNKGKEKCLQNQGRKREEEQKERKKQQNKEREQNNKMRQQNEQIRQQKERKFLLSLKKQKSSLREIKNQQKNNLQCVPDRVETKQMVEENKATENVKERMKSKQRSKGKQLTSSINYQSISPHSQFHCTQLPINSNQSKIRKHINIVMDLYDCDLYQYLQINPILDHLTLKIFSYQILRAVLYLHSNQICHRDIKPQNLLIKNHHLVLSDLGSAKIMKNHKNSNVSYICSRFYRAPQLILGYKYYDKSIDIWSIGCVMAELALGKPLFPGVNSLDQLIKIIRILGQPNWRKISFMIEKIPKIPQIQSKGLKNIFSKDTSSLFVNLIETMLTFNPLHRITAGQALCHQYFDEIRDQMSFNEICKQMNISHFLKFNRDQLKQSQHLKNKLIPTWYSQTK